MPSRISGACTPCRSKKQKCSGHHPTCTQCTNTSIECTWPEQRKRGPAKGYIEGLESRLHSAESLLLALLPLVSDNLIEKASQSVRSNDDEDSAGRRSSPPLLNKKIGLDYWDSFPLDTRKNIRIWQFDCEANSSNGNHNSSSQYTTRDSNNLGRRYRSPTKSPHSIGIASPRRSSSANPQPQQHIQQPNNWIQSMQPYVTPQHQNQMQAGAAQQLLNMSNPPRRDQWMSRPQTDSMQLDPNLMQPRSMPSQAAQIYASNVQQQSLFW